MPKVSSSRMSVGAAALLVLVCSLLLTPLASLVPAVIAAVTGGSSPPRLLVAADPISDAVSATPAEFRVDESGAATYTIPIYGVPGTAGVVPQLSLSYSSQGTDGPLGKGWSIGGLSSITRCRATREAGDFLGAATPDGQPRPVNFSASDRYCLDGQRLVPMSATCPSAGGMSGVALGTEIDSFKRVCAYSASGSTTGPAFFTVESKDGSLSFYGDRDATPTSNRPDGYVESNSPTASGAALAWAQTRFQDSTGNYIDYIYAENPAGANSGEHLIKEVRYTGHVALAGQSSTVAPYAKIQFNYAPRPAAQWSRGYVAGGVVTASQRLESITACASAGSGCPTADQARHVLLTYAAAPSGSGMDALVGLQECRDSTGAVCSAPTAFVWSSGLNQFASSESPGRLPIDTAYYRGHKLGDINGDGRADLVYLRAGNVNCSTDWIVSQISSFDAAGIPTFSGGASHCVADNIGWNARDYDRGEGGWNLLDYNGDGREDLFVSTFEGQAWRVHPSNGAGFDMSQNLLAGLTGIIPTSNYANDQPHLVDLNGDGLTDVMYGLRARLMERQGASFGWGSERMVSFDAASLNATFTCDPGDTCTSTAGSQLTALGGYTQLADFNGDAASDVLIPVTTNIRFAQPECDFSRAQSQYENFQVETPAADKNGAAPAARPCVNGGVAYNLGAFSVQSMSSTQIVLTSYGPVAPSNALALQLADFNGDGLTDTAYRNPLGGAWYARINTGNGLQYGVELPVPGGFEAQTKFVDANGDGRSDALYLTDNGGKVYYWRKALPGGGFATGAPLPGGNARHCEGGSCNVDQSVSWFADMEGDGNQDFYALGLSSSSPSLYVSRSHQRFSPRDVITQVVNGLGSETDISYLPMTNSGIYRADSGSRNSLNWGRGSPVSDVRAPSYVVARAASSSPAEGNPNAKAALYYRYAGGRMQAGGRGFLGFREIVTFDVNENGGYVATTTTYAQNFPYIGSPLQTVKAAILGQAYIPPSCVTGAVSNSCFAVPGESFAGVGGSGFSNQVHTWEMAPASLGIQVPLHVRTLGTEESLRDPYTGAASSRVVTAFSYGANGNVTQTIEDTYTGTSSLTSTLTTSNTYSDDTTKWRLGRLTASTIRHMRPGQADVVRTTGFSYAMGGTQSGLLTEERTQPGGAADQQLTVAYGYDDFGNKVHTSTCAAPATDCSPAGFVMQPASSLTVKRYTRTQYDATGRFPVAVVEPFSTQGGTGSSEHVTTRVSARNIFGDATEVWDVNNARSLQVKGQLGRDYYTWQQSAPHASPGNGGVASLSTYRWCGAVECPTGARFRQQVTTTGAPASWSYFDALGRPLLKVAETFNAGVSGKDIAGVCTQYDVVGRVRRTSNPFFLGGVGGANGPTGLAGACSDGARQWTTTTYDILGRATAVQMPDGNTVTSSYTGLTTTTRDARNNPTSTTRNGKGELVSTIDAAGFATDFSYSADGNIASVSRNAGNGAITNHFSYDTLGRKVQQNDPDTGLSTFEYNALGELVAQTANSGERTENAIDGRGRTWRTTAKTSAGAIESQSTFAFDEAFNGLGQPSSQSTTGTYAGLVGQNGTELNYRRDYVYDAMGRVSTSLTTIDGEQYLSATEFDALGRPWRSMDASGQWSKTQYSPRGVVAVCASAVGDIDPACGGSAEIYTRTLETDAWGNAVRERRADTAAMEVTRSYHPQTGRLSQICAGTNCNLVNEAYAWDAAGNLSTHQKGSRYTETFSYDALNRLTEARLSMVNGVFVNQVSLANGYDALGNVCTHNSLTLNYSGDDGCIAGAGSGFTAPSQASRIPQLLPARSSVTRTRNLPAYARHRFSRAVEHAPDYRLARYSRDEDAPSWEHEADDWTLFDDKQPTRYWVKHPEASRVRASATAEVSPTSSQPLPGNGSPHAVTRSDDSTGSTFYYYDGRGNQTVKDAPGTGNDRTIRYSADGHAYDIQMGGGQRVRFWYGPGGQRYKREEAGKVTLYLDGVELTIQGSMHTAKRYIAGVALQSVVNGVAQATQYLFQDHLGSVVRITNAAGAVVEGLDYTAFGERRGYADPNTGNGAASSTPRGFTGHEMVDGTGIIHMNGRIYDQQLGRFLQPDPIIQEPGNAQSWNAYTYVFNNPLAYTDPTGNIAFRQILGFAIAVVGTIFAPQFTSLWAKIGYAAAIGFASGYVASGTLRGGVAGAFTAAVTLGIANGFSGGAQLFAQAYSGGIIEAMQGGRFGHAFVAAGLTAAAMPQLGNLSKPGAATLGALIGGTASAVTGGKFANGAISGAIQGAMAGRQTKQVEDYFDHATLPDGEIDGVPSEMPAETNAALRKILKSPIGKGLARYVDANGGKITLVETPVIDAFKQIGDNEIWYTRDISAYARMKISEGNSIFGDGLSTATLDSLLVHEIGHTVIGSMSINQSPIHVYNKSDSLREEMRAIRGFENPYRESRGLPKRCSYWTVGDLCN